MNYPRCKTCKHFIREPKHAYPDMGFNPVEVWPGFCAAMRGPFDSDDPDTWPGPLRMAITVDGSTYKADLLVTEDFGCILHTDMAEGTT